MVSKELIAASTRPLVLSVLAKGDSYGYAIIQRVRDLSGGELEWSEGMLYPVLHRLEREKLILSSWKTSDSGRRRKYYRLSARGARAIEVERKQWHAVHQTLAQLWGEPAMYDLEQQIALWKKEIGQSESMSGANLAELEQHLRDSVSDLIDGGLSAEEALLIAQRRLGNSQALATEYRKVNGSYVWRRRVFWMLAGYVVIRLAAAWIGTLSSMTTTVAAYAGFHGTAMGIIAASVTWIGWILLLAALYLVALQGRPGSLTGIQFSFSGAMAFGLAAAIAAGVVLAMAARAWTVQIVSAESYGQSQLVMSTAGLALQLVAPLLCLALMWALRRRGYGMAPRST